MNRIKALFANKDNEILNVYFTAGHPGLNDTKEIIENLFECGVDLVEIGMPYSDPLADGPTIQNSSKIALKNGMHLNLLFDQISELRQICDIPIIIMGYYNQMMQYAEARFLEKAKSSGVDGLIIPDLPMDIYEREFKNLFEQNDLSISFLITPETSDNRIRQADRLSSGFLYVVSKSSITGSASDISESQKNYFNRLTNLELTTPRLIGFGIHDRITYETACRYSSGAIIGSAFIRALEREGSLEDKIQKFVKTIR